MNWFRLYHELRHDRKLSRLSQAEKWQFVVLLILASESENRGVIELDEETICDELETDADGCPVFYHIFSFAMSGKFRNFAVPKIIPAHLLPLASTAQKGIFVLSEHKFGKGRTQLSKRHRINSVAVCMSRWYSWWLCPAFAVYRSFYA